MQATKYFTMARPTLLWICVAALNYHFIVYYFFVWIYAVKFGFTMPPPIENEKLDALIALTVLLAGIRSFDKLKGTDTKSIK